MNQEQNNDLGEFARERFVNRGMDRNVDSSKGNHFLKDLIRYVRVRSIQIVRFSAVGIFLLKKNIESSKSVVIRKMYWGRTSFYRIVFQTSIVTITITALLISISTRVNVSGAEEQGIIASSGAIGNNDIFLQVGTADSITEVQASEFDFIIEKYEVKPGDTLSGIASKFGVSDQTIRWANKIPDGRDTLTVGQVLDIPPMNGVLYTVVAGDNLAQVLKKVDDANEFDLIELNDLQAPEYTLAVGQKLFIPDATYKPPVVAKKITSSTSSGSYVNTNNTSLNVPSGTFVNPMQQCSGYRFLRGWRYSHTGVDLGHSSGCWIVSAGAGSVEKAGWCGRSMGFCVIVKHDNGFRTLYMHGQGGFAVKSGQRVGAGQRLLTLGCTGNCTGPHLHLSLAPPGKDVVTYRNRINPYGIIPY